MADPSNAVSREDVAKVARLARLRLEEDELDRIWPQLATIVGYVEQLAEVDTDGIEPMAHAVERTDVMRDDVVTPMLPLDEAVANAPKSDGTYFLVPQIIDAE